MSFESNMAHCARHEDKIQRYQTLIDIEEARITAETLGMARCGNYSRLLNAMDYRSNDQLVMHHLVLCANKGDFEAKQVLNKLARTYAEFNAKVQEPDD